MSFRCAHSPLVPTLLLASACVSSSPQGTDASVLLDLTPSHSNASIPPTLSLGRREIAAFEGRPLSDALLELRPEWLRTAPSMGPSDGDRGPVVYANDVPAGAAASLRTIPSDVVLEVRFLRAVEAQTRFGPSCRCPAGVISVRTHTER